MNARLSLYIAAGCDGVLVVLIVCFSFSTANLQVRRLIGVNVERELIDLLCASCAQEVHDAGAEDTQVQERRQENARRQRRLGLALGRPHLNVKRVAAHDAAHNELSNKHHHQQEEAGEREDGAADNTCSHTRATVNATEYAAERQGDATHQDASAALGWSPGPAAPPGRPCLRGR
ncbi:hypothetical protein ON010_g17414 [Phytophthora cinnamomi]|nr:hypothetical protein ON010_g17414 [Phytophthora cinnamomi]